MSFTQFSGCIYVCFAIYNRFAKRKIESLYSYNSTFSVIMISLKSFLTAIKCKDDNSLSYQSADSSQSKAVPPPPPGAVVC